MYPNESYHSIQHWRSFQISAPILLSFSFSMITPSSPPPTYPGTQPKQDRKEILYQWHRLRRGAGCFALYAHRIPGYISSTQAPGRQTQKGGSLTIACLQCSIVNIPILSIGLSFWRFLFWNGTLSSTVWRWYYRFVDDICCAEKKI